LEALDKQEAIDDRDRTLVNNSMGNHGKQSKPRRAQAAKKRVVAPSLQERLMQRANLSNDAAQQL
jgi:hypothetical protein